MTEKPTAPIQAARPSRAAAQPKVSEFTRRIEARMLALGMNKKELATRAGIARQTLYTILDMGRSDDDRMPRVSTLLALAGALRVHPFWLVDGLFANVVVPASLDQEVRGDRAGFVEDVTFPGGALVAPGAHFVKVWRVQNLGNETWKGRKLVCRDDALSVTLRQTGEPLPIGKRLRPDAMELAVPTTPPGGVVELSMGFTAPMAAGMLVSYWLGTFADGTPCFGEDAGLEVLVNVTTLGASRAFRSKNLTE